MGGLMLFSMDFEVMGLQLGSELEKGWNKI